MSWQIGDECGVKLSTGEIIQDWQIQVVDRESKTVRVWHETTDRVWLRSLDDLVCIHWRKSKDDWACAIADSDMWKCEQCPVFQERD